MAVTVLQEQRRNHATNPSFETNATSWSGLGSSTIARSTTRAQVGSASGLITMGAGAGISQGASTTVTGLTVGQVYTASIWLYVPAASLSANVALWVIGGSATSPVVATADTWVRVSATFTAATTSHALNVLNEAAATAGMTVYADGLLVELSSTAGTYFDGATTDTGTSTTLGATVYDWTGTAHASKSIASLVVRGLNMTVTPEPDAEPPRLRIDITDTGSPAITAVTILRLDADGRYRRVRTSDDGPLPISGGGATVYDYEPLGYGTQVTYSTDQVGGPTAVAVLDVDDIWLIHPGVPSRSVRVDSVSKLGPRARAVQQGKFVVLEREDPVMVTGGARSTPAGLLGVRTATDAQRRAMDLLLDDASPVLLNIPVGKRWGFDSSYLAIGDTDEDRPVRYGPVPLREWALPYQVISRPTGGTQAAIIWNDVATRGADDYTAQAGSQYMTWQAIADAGVTSWAELSAPTT